MIELTYDLLLTYETTYMYVYYIHVQTEMYRPKCPKSQFLKEQTRQFFMRNFFQQVYSISDHFISKRSHPSRLIFRVTCPQGQ